jgi:hypothetical protein
MTDKVQKIRKEVEKLHGNPYYMMAVKDVLAIIDPLQEEPISEDLEEASFDYAEACKYDGGEKLLCVEHFKAGAKWQKEQFEKNRLADCDRQTEEEAEIERDFCMGIIENEHRQPTFDDAIKYGMKLKEKEMKSTIELAEDHAMLAGMEKMKQEMMGDAVDAEVITGTVIVERETMKTFLKYHGLKTGDKVKLIIIREE